MRIRDPMHESEEPYNLIPLTDMVFNLLIFFMCATTFVQVEKELSLKLPNAGIASGLTPSAPTELVINIRRDGGIVVEGKTISLEELRGKVAKAAQSGVQAVVIRADEQSVLKYFAEVAKLCKSAGVQEARLVYIETGSAK